MEIPINLDELNLPGARMAEPPKRGNIWYSTMPEERDIISRMVDTGEAITMDYGTAERMKRMRFRFYRCKRQLLANGNRYMERITFEAVGSRLTVRPVEGLTKYIVEGPRE